ncbi:MAG TPA: hypothetical protein VJA23_02290 [Candidatus Nanoarchaeia archaeon]|nr:hypothetical protein [Candidatus Nanoarchaeia archaeon]
MFLDLSKPRADYFDEPTIAEILRRVILKDGNISAKDINSLAAEKRVIGTEEGELEPLLDGKEYTPNSLSLVGKIETLQPDQLLVLPQSYRIPAGESRQRLVYDLDTLVRLDDIEVKRAILGEIVPAGRLSARRKEQEEWSPEKVLRAAFDHLHQHRNELAEHTFAAYSWFGKDNHRRIVSLYRAIQGAELRAFQNLTAYRLVIPTMRKDLRLGKSAESSYKENLSPEQSERRKDKIRKYEKHLQRKRREGQPLGQYVAQLDVNFSDLIETVSRPFAYHGGRLMHVPSRSRPEIGYNVKITGIPLLEPGNPAAYSQVWELRGKCVCEDKTYRSDRRRSAIDSGQDEDFFCPHEIAALHTLRSIYEKDNKETIPFLPFVLPTAEMMDFVEKLRNQTVMVTYNPTTGKASRRELNHTEMENLLWKRVMARGYDQCFTTDVNTFRARGYDPLNDLVKFKG